MVLGVVETSHFGVFFWRSYLTQLEFRGVCRRIFYRWMIYRLSLWSWLETCGEICSYRFYIL